MLTKRTLGKTGLVVSSLGFGSSPIGFRESDPAQAATLLHLLLDLGVNVIDTGECYAAAEDMIGNEISHRRDEYVLITKCGHKFSGADAEDWSPQLIRQSVDRSLRRLRTECIDVMLLHTCDMDILKKGDVMEVLIKAREHGKLRFIGFSGDNAEAAYAATLPDISVIETSINICDQSNFDSVLAPAVVRGLGVIAKGPIANAVWRPLESLRGVEGGYERVRPYAERFRQMGLRLSGLGFGGPAEKSWLELALRFAISIPSVHTAVVGTRTPNYMQDNVMAAAKGPLPSTIVQALREVFRCAERQCGKKWPGIP
jgi:aryl-alcohol dehydrogenase-like predicted oxidoreductase